MDGLGQQAVVKATRSAASIQKVDTVEFNKT